MNSVITARPGKRAKFFEKFVQNNVKEDATKFQKIYFQGSFFWNENILHSELSKVPSQFGVLPNFDTLP